MRRALLSAAILVMSFATVGCVGQPELEPAPVAAAHAPALAAPALAPPAAAATAAATATKDDDTDARRVDEESAVFNGDCLPNGPDDCTPVPGPGHPQLPTPPDVRANAPALTGGCLPSGPDDCTPGPGPGHPMPQIVTTHLAAGQRP
jgi:hypothetical protein